jgi:hypothetical protein
MRTWSALTKAAYVPRVLFLFILSSVNTMHYSFQKKKERKKKKKKLTNMLAYFHEATGD